MTRKLLPLAIAFGLSAPSLVLAGPAPDQDTAPAAAKEDEKAKDQDVLDTVIVTGTRRDDRTVAESLAPIDVLQPEELQNAGTPDLQAVLTRLVPSFNYPRTSITDASDHVRPAQLRGLSPDQTLVLINGKRRHRTAIININGTIGRGSSPADLNAIPLSAIDHVEVLRDGASAQYGSDAIAGVINVVLKSADSGGSADVRVGGYDKGDGDLRQTSGNVGFGLGDGGFVNVTAEFRDKDATNRSTPDRRQQYPLVNGAPDPREATFDRINHRFGDADTIDRLLFLNAELPVSENTRLYAFGGASNRDGEAAGFFRRALDARNVPSIHPDGFLPLIVTDVKDRSGVFGATGVWGAGWQWDLSANVGDSDFDFNVHDSVNTSLGASSPTRFFAGTLSSGQELLNLDLRNSFDVSWLVTPLSTAFGAEYRRETFEIERGDPNSYFGTGSQVFPGFRPSDEIDASRHSYALYADLEGDVTENLTLGGALRYEDFSDFGDKASGKFSARYAFSPEYALRGTVSTGFHAPNLQQQYYSTTATNFINGQPFDIRTFPVSSPIAQALGAEPLKAEESTNYSLGFVAQPTEAFYFTIDLYRIDIDDRIILSENLTGTGVRNFLTAQGFPGVDGGRYFTNAVDTRTKGLDVIGRYNWDLGNAGQLVTTLGYNRNDTDIEAVAPNPEELNAANLQLQRIGRVEIGRLTVGSPRDKIILGGDYYLGDFTARLTGTRYGDWSVLNANAAQDDHFDAQWVVDLALSYRFGPATFTLGAENLNNVYPAQVSTVLVTDANGFVSSGPGDNSNSGILPYARGEAPFGFNGRFYYAKVGFEW